MNRHRYEAVPQREATQPIILSPIPVPSSSNSYNFNSGLPSGSTAPSSIAPSIPNSPPPSFHTTSSPGTPRPLPSQELWGVAPSTIGTEHTLGGTSNDALATIAGLKQRVEWLEESIGRLLLEKERVAVSDNGADRDDAPRLNNCCVVFTDANQDIEHMGRRNNCCVSFKHRSSDKAAKREAQLRWMIVGCFVFFVGVIGFTIVSSAYSRTKAAALYAAAVEEGKKSVYPS